MKSLFLFLFFCTTTIYSSAQFLYTLRVKNTQGQMMRNVEVTAVNSLQDITLRATTDNEGIAFFQLIEPGTYKFSFLEAKDVVSAEVKPGMRGKFTRSVTYDPKGVFAEKPKADRTGISFATGEPYALRNDRSACKVNISVKTTKLTLVPHVHISIVSVKNKIKYSSKTNASGKAIFYLPVNEEYEVDVEGIIAYDHLSINAYSGMELSEVIFYEKTKVNEIVKGDTLVQNRIAQTAGTSSHIHYTLNLKDFNGDPLANEPVYMKAMNSARVFEGKTNDQGKCVLMLLKGDDYILNLKHESGLLLVNAPTSKGFKTESSTRRYRGSKVIEKLIAEQKAEMDHIMAQFDEKSVAQNAEMTFHETPVEKIGVPENYLRQTPEGFNIDFSNSGRAGTPTVIGDRMYSQQGMYSSNYFCLKANTGSFLWGLELGESGISPAVYHKGILLINTASCTLYAIDAESGELLWSRWLASYVYSTPTADDNSVYVVYSHGGYPVIVSFDLRTGKFNWMQPVDNEAIACPVIAGNEVHLASQSGIYYVFDKESGDKMLTSSTVKVVSSPTIVGDNIFVTASFGVSEKLVVLDRKTLKLKKTYSTSLTSLKTTGVRNVDETDQMNFNGSHPIVYQNKYVIVTDRGAIRAFDANSEKLIWEKPIATNSDQLPIVANDRVIITSTTGDVISYDIETGTSKLIKKVDGDIEGQPIARNGLLFIAAGGIIKVIKIIQRFTWNQWNKDASHNTVWE
ncbi:MAG: PQQ-binding-like beta-propeller repeat protein [Crocinitomicaceae bacterium]|nr:PQQ-binding-like beta-propeller repeat protein [Crocinitomicaceae bacterium]